MAWAPPLIPGNPHLAGGLDRSGRLLTRPVTPAHYAERSGPAADQIPGIILRAIDGLAPFPLNGRPDEVPETRERIVVHYPYRIVYHVDEVNQVVEVWRVVHGA